LERKGFGSFAKRVHPGLSKLLFKSPEGEFEQTKFFLKKEYFAAQYGKLSEFFSEFSSRTGGQFCEN